MDPSIATFDQRKKDHIEISLDSKSQSLSDQFSKIQLQHNPLPELNLEDVDIRSSFLDFSLSSPLFISSMTLGHEESGVLNERLVSGAQEMGWMMGVGSQRRQLFDSQAAQECESLRARFPKAHLFGNIGLSQIIQTKSEEIQSLVDSLGAQFMVVHSNPLQEAIQKEGTPQFRGGFEALQRLCEDLSVPVVLKETGCGFSESSLSRLKEIGLAALDVSGRGGTHWGRVEMLRLQDGEPGLRVGQTFANWGLSTLDSLKNATKQKLPFEVWGSGGVRNGLQAAQLLAIGASKVGMAQPLLKAALQGEKELIETMKVFEQELKVAMFCMGTGTLKELIGNEDVVKWI